MLKVIAVVCMGLFLAGCPAITAQYDELFGNTLEDRCAIRKVALDELAVDPAFKTDADRQRAINLARTAYTLAGCKL